MMVGSGISWMYLALGLYALIPMVLIAVGLLIFFGGRRYVERKYGKKPR